MLQFFSIFLRRIRVLYGPLPLFGVHFYVCACNVDAGCLMFAHRDVCECAYLFYSGINFNVINGQFSV